MALLELRLNQHVFGLAFAKGQMITANLNFKRIAHRGSADENHRRSHEQPHFTKAERCRPAFAKFPHHGTRAHGEFRKFDDGGHRKGGSKAALLVQPDLLHQNAACGAVTQSDSRPVNLTKNGACAGDLGDERGLAKTHLAYPLAEIAIAGQLAHPSGCPRRELAERNTNGDRQSRHESSDTNETQFQWRCKKKARTRGRAGRKIFSDGGV